jgi:hypothetical protein
MSIDFEKEACQQVIQANRFGICDDLPQQPAYLDTTEPQKWMAIVENEAAFEITFTAIDNCIEIRRANGDMDNRCDGMLTYDDNIIFVELKNVRSEWITNGLAQLERTIQHFMDHYDMSVIRHKRAFLCNKKHPQFQVIEQATKQQFFQKYKVRINIQAVIKT